MHLLLLVYFETNIYVKELAELTDG